MAQLEIPLFEQEIIGSQKDTIESEIVKRVTRKECKLPYRGKKVNELTSHLSAKDGPHSNDKDN